MEMLTKGGQNPRKHKRNDDEEEDCPVTPDSTTEPPRPAHDFQEGDDVFFHTEEGQHILGTVGQITAARCQILFGDGTEQWAPFVRIKKLSCSFDEQGPSPPLPADNSTSSNCSSSSSFPSQLQQKAEVVCIVCKNVKKMSSRKARLFNANLPFKCNRCTSSTKAGQQAISSGGSMPNHSHHHTPTAFHKKASVPRQLLRRLSTSSPEQIHPGGIPTSTTTTSQYLPTSSFASLKSSNPNTNNNMMAYRSSLNSPPHSQLNSIMSTNNTNSGSNTNILNQQSGSMTIKPIRTGVVHLSNPAKNQTINVPKTNLCFHCGNRTCLYDRVHCNMCERYCHVSCLPSVTPPALEGDKFWDVMCTMCGTQNESEKGGSKVFSCRRSITSWTDVVNLIINCLKVKSLGQQYFDFDNEIMPFFDKYIDRLHLPRQYKSAAREDRKINLLAALKNSRFREVKESESGWALKSDFSSRSASSSSTATSTSNNMNACKPVKSKANMTTSTTKIISPNSNNDIRDLGQNQVRSTTTTIPNYSSNNNHIKKITLPYGTNNLHTSYQTANNNTTTITNRPNNLHINHMNQSTAVTKSVSPTTTLNAAKSRNSSSIMNMNVNNNNITINSYNNASKPCDMSVNFPTSPHNLTNIGGINTTNNNNNNFTGMSFPRVLSKEALLRNPPTIATNIILSPTKSSLMSSSNTGSCGFQNKNVGYLNSSSSHSLSLPSPSDCDKRKTIQEQKNESTANANKNKELRNSPRKSLKLNKSQKDDSEKSKPKPSSSSSSSLNQNSESNRQRLRIRTPTKPDSSATTTTSGSKLNHNETATKDGQMKRKEITLLSSLASSKNLICHPMSSTPVIDGHLKLPSSPSSSSATVKKRSHAASDEDGDVINMSNDSTMIALVNNSTHVENTIVVRATKIARMDDNSPPTSTSKPSTASGSRPTPITGRPKLTRSSSLNIKNGKITNNNSNNTNKINKNNGKPQAAIGRVVRGRGRPLGSTSKGMSNSNVSSAKKEEIGGNGLNSFDNLNNNNGKVFNPPNGLTESLPNGYMTNNNGWGNKITRNGNNNGNNGSSTGKLRKIPSNQNEALLLDSENNQDDNVVDSDLDTFSSNLLNAAVFGGIKPHCLPRIPETKSEIEEEKRKVGEYLLAEAAVENDEESTNNKNDMNSNNNTTPGTEGGRSDSNYVKRLFSNSTNYWPSRQNFPQVKESPAPPPPATTNILGEYQNVRNNFIKKNNNSSKKGSKRSLDDVDSYDILSMRVGEDGIIRYEIVWWEEVSSDEDDGEEENYEEDDVVEEEKDKIETKQPSSSSSSKREPGGDINIKVEEEIEARKSLLGTKIIHTSNRQPLNSSSSPGRINNISKHQFLSIDDDEDDLQILSTTSKQNSSTTTTKTTEEVQSFDAKKNCNQIPYVIDLTDSP